MFRIQNSTSNFGTWTSDSGWIPLSACSEFSVVNSENSALILCLSGIFESRAARKRFAQAEIGGGQVIYTQAALPSHGKLQRDLILRHRRFSEEGNVGRCGVLRYNRKDKKRNTKAQRQEDTKQRQRFFTTENTEGTDRKSYHDCPRREATKAS